MPRMRTIEQAFACTQAADADTALTKTALRRLVTTGAIPAVKVGCKYLVDVDGLQDFLAAGTPTPKPVELGQVRRVC